MSASVTGPSRGWSGNTGASMNSSETSSLALGVTRDDMTDSLTLHTWVEEEKVDLEAPAC